MSTTSIDNLTLFHTHGIGPVLYSKLLEYFGSDAAILASSVKQRQEINLSPQLIENLNRPNLEAIDRDQEWLEEKNNHIIDQTSPLYPPMLKEIHDPPILLYVHGNPDCLTDFQIAIVGSRNPTSNGKQSAFEFAHALGTGGFTITSGLALGIDGAAHKGALAAKARTLAITGTGLDRVYPAAHQPLAHKIAEQGALISEFPLGSAPEAHHFPRRNRIISALCTGCLIVEGALRSGSLITARHALEQGREVFAIPGSIHNPLTKGCHHIIREGAKLVENEQDIVDELASLLTAQHELNSRPDTNQQPTSVSNTINKARHSTNKTNLEEDTQDLLNSIAFDPVSADTLCVRSGYNIEKINSMLLILELKGYINVQAGGCYTRCP
ncbi:Rossmann fold nucleotide-binding protein Smf possibly involved in DNA uptake [hydrothermal vent metagenome]|uniref:Rossmann fold nucleotide-binding protein Smf possibly involved in DNA uptake n=1 Tax=hydrothermal vent metagenome TaxID=652676 RepID=A0A3B0Z1F4_9ZZZZ